MPDTNITPNLTGEAAAVHPNGGTAWNGSLLEYPWWGGAIGEAVSLLGYERNTDRIIGAFYVRSFTLSPLQETDFVNCHRHPLSEV